MKTLAKSDFKILIGADISESTKLLKQDITSIEKVLQKTNVLLLPAQLNVARTKNNIQKQIPTLVKEISKIEVPPITLDVAINTSNLNKKLATALKAIELTEAKSPTFKQQSWGEDLIVKKQTAAAAEVDKLNNKILLLGKTAKDAGVDLSELYSYAYNIGDKSSLDEYNAAMKTAQSQVEKLRSELALLKKAQDEVAKSEPKYNTNLIGMEKQTTSLIANAEKNNLGTGNINELKELQTRIQALRKETESIPEKTFLDELTDGQKEELDAINKKLKEMNLLITQGSSENRNKTAYLTRQKELEKLISSVKKYREENDRIGENSYLDAQYSRLIEHMEQLATSSDISTAQLVKQRLEFDRLKDATEQAGVAGQSFGQKIAAAYQKFGGWALITKSMMEAVHIMQQMVSNVYMLDSAMTELKKVTDETNATYEQFFSTAAKNSKELGVVMSDYIYSTADFARLGYELEDATALADAASVYKSVGDGIESINQASASVISTMKAFNIEASDAMSVVDKFNEVGNNFAISSAGVGDALMRSASALREAGNTIDESIGLIVAANQVIQDPDQAGNALKVLSLRLRGAKADLESLGESTDGMVETTAKLREELLALSHGKVDIMLDDSTFKSTYQIIKEMSVAWKDMTDIEQAAALELMGGKQRSNILASMITNFEEAEKAAQVSASSMGSALKENETQLDSIKGKVAQFQSAYQSLSATVINSGLAKSFVDGGTSIISVLDQIIQKIGGLPTLVAAATGAFTLNTGAGLFQLGDNNKMASFAEQVKNIKEYFTDLDGTKASGKLRAQTEQDIEALKRYTTALGEGKTRQEAMSKSMDGASSAAKKYAETMVGTNDEIVNFAVGQSKAADQMETMSLKSRVAAASVTLLNTALNMAVAAAASFVVGAVIGALVDMANASENARQATLENIASMKKYDEITGSYEKSIKSIKESLDSNTLSEKQAYEARKELVDIQNELIEQYGEEAKYLDLVNGKYDEQIERLKNLSKEKAKQQANDWLSSADNIKSSQDAEKAMQVKTQVVGGIAFDSKAAEDEFKRIIDNLNDSISYDMNSAGGIVVKITANPEEATEAISELYGALSEFKKTAPEYSVDIDRLIYSSGQYKDQMQSVLDDYQEIYKTSGMQQIIADDTFEPVYRQMAEASSMYQEAILEGNDEMVKQSIELFNAAKEEYENLDFTNDGAAEYAFQGIIEQIQDQLASEELEIKITTNENNIQSVLQDIASEFEGLRVDQIINIEDGGGTEEQIWAFTRLSELAKGLGVDVETLTYKMQELGYIDVSTTENSVAQLDFTFDELMQGIDETQSAWQTLEQAQQEYNQAGYLTMDTLQGILSMDAMYWQYLQMENGQLQINREGLIALANARIDDAEAAMYEKAADLVDKFNSEARTAEDLSSALEGLAQARLTEAEAAWEQAYAAAMAKGGVYAQYANEMANSLQNMGNIFDQVRSKIGSYSSAIMNAGQATANAANQMKQALSQAKSAIQSLLDMTIKMLKQDLTTQRDGIQDMIDAENDRYNAERDHLQDMKEAKDDYYDDLIDSLQDQKKAQDKIYDDQIDHLNDEIDAYRKIIEAKLKIIETQEKEREYQDELAEKQKGIADIEAELAEISQDDSIEAQKKRLELEEQLAEQKKELEDFQHDYNIENQKEDLENELDRYEEEKQAAIDRIEAEKERYDEYMQDRIDSLQKEKEDWNEYYQDRLDDLANEHQARLDNLNSEKEAITNQINDEAALRQQAIALIEGRSEEFKNRLLAWNKEYGDGINATVIVAWEKAYAALEQYNYQQIGVQGVLENIVMKMYELEKATKSATEAAKDFNNELSKQVQGPQQNSNWLHKSDGSVIPVGVRHKGGYTDENGEKRVGTFQELVDGLKSDEQFLITKAGEYVATQEDQNAIVRGFNRAMEMVASFSGLVRDVMPISEITDRFNPSVASEEILNNSLYNNSQPISFSIQTDILGNADDELMNNWWKTMEPTIKQKIASYVFGEINWKRSLR